MTDNQYDEQNRSENGSNNDWQPHYDFHNGYNAPQGGGRPPQKKGSGGVIAAVCVSVFLCLAALAAIGILGLGGGGLPSLTGSTVSGETSSGDTGTVSPNITDSSTSHSFTGSDLDIDIGDVQSSTEAQPGVVVAKKVRPSIVGVLNYVSSRDSYILSGTGSGIVLSEDGFILTNQHVVDGADQVAVTLYSENGMDENDSYIAQVVGEDSTTDIALLKIDITGLTPAEFANSDDVLVGETVFAVGNPGGLEFSTSISQGLVSGLNRNLEAGGFIQTDVAINPGNSGGALVNIYGQVIGVTSEKIVSVSDISAEGLGFAIPSNTAIAIVNQLLEHGYVTGRVSLQITVNVYTDAYAEMLGLPEGCRILVKEVRAGSNAATAGLRQGLFITHVNGIAVSSTNDLQSERDKNSPGDTITITVYDPELQKSHDISFVLEEDRG